ncbi:MAG: metal ABC transporter ATP-binding protein [Lachnospiraceae bacterium]|nr:metal ABC transporter ATP-binding protein [Lachnospiraceae bacterium]
MKIHNSCGLCTININDLSVISGSQEIIKNINMEFHCGELTAIVGKNGAGKTTLIRSILGERKHAGTITYKNHHGETLSRPKTGYVPQQLSFDKSTPVTVMDFLSSLSAKKPVWFGFNKKEKEEIIKRLEALNCADVYDKKLGNLSGGELQRVLLAAATHPMPDLLILDEPVSGIDAAGLDMFYKLVTELRDNYHMAILLVSHDLPLIKKYADKTIVLDKTVVISGDTEEVFASKEFKATMGLDF